MAKKETNFNIADKKKFSMTKKETIYNGAEK